jgi:peroxiredoxin
LREAYDQITDLGAEVVGVSTLTSREAREAARVGGLPYPVFGDPAHAAIDAYGVLHVDEPEGRVITRPALFLIDREGYVRYAHVGEHARDRPALGAVLLALESMG